MSIKKKLLLLLILVVIGLFSSALTGFFFINKVQIGSYQYEGILLQRNLIDDIARIRVNLNIIKNLAQEMDTTEDTEMIGDITPILESTGKLLQHLVGYSKKSATGISCFSCHNTEMLSEFIDLNDKLVMAFSQYKAIFTDHIFPLVQQENFEEAAEFRQDQLDEYYYQLMGSTKGQINTLRDAASAMETTIVLEAGRLKLIYVLGGLFMSSALITIILFIIKSTNSILTTTVSSLKESSTQISDTANHVYSSSEIMAGSANSIAASLDETSKSLAVMTASTKTNAQGSEEANKRTQDMCALVVKANKSMADTLINMNNIKENNNEIASIIKVIESISFQTNLLALNAAVEAARAGEHGAGFAVVAEEVRNLARRVSESATETDSRIETAIANINDGLTKVDAIAKQLTEINNSAMETVEMMQNITETSKKQSSDIVEINTALSDIDTNVQNLSDQAQTLSSGSSQLDSQTSSLDENVEDLKKLAGH